MADSNRKALEEFYEIQRKSKERRAKLIEDRLRKEKRFIRIEIACYILIFVATILILL